MNQLLCRPTLVFFFLDAVVVFASSLALSVSGSARGASLDCQFFLDSNGPSRREQAQRVIDFYDRAYKQGDSRGHLQARWTEFDGLPGTLRVEPRIDSSQHSVLFFAHALFLHGMGSFKSLHRAFEGPLAVFGNPLRAKKSGTRRQVMRWNEYIPLKASAIDLMLHGMGPSPEEMDWTYEETMHWMGAYIDSEISRHPESDLIGFARSSSPALMTPFLDRFRAVIWISPEKPGDADLAPLQRAATELGIREDHTEVHVQSLEWKAIFSSRIEWNEETLGKTPILIMTGSRDPEVLPEERAFYRRLAEAIPSVEYIEIVGAGHDVFSKVDNQDRAPALTAYRAVYQFLQRHQVGRAFD